MFQQLESNINAIFPHFNGIGFHVIAFAGNIVTIAQRELETVKRANRIALRIDITHDHFGTGMWAFGLKAIELILVAGDANRAFSDFGLNDIVFSESKLFNGIGNKFPIIFLGCHSRSTGILFCKGSVWRTFRGPG